MGYTTHLTQKVWNFDFAIINGYIIFCNYNSYIIIVAIILVHLWTPYEPTALSQINIFKIRNII